MSKFIVLAALGLIPAIIASRRKRRFIVWWCYGTFLFLSSLPHSLLLKRKSSSEQQSPEVPIAAKDKLFTVITRATVGVLTVPALVLTIGILSPSNEKNKERSIPASPANTKVTPTPTTDHSGPNSEAALPAPKRRIEVPTDPKAEYYLIDKGGTSRRPIITTERIGRSGVSYSRREFNCEAWSFRYIGDGETIEGMNASTPDPTWSTIVPHSIEDYLGQEACSRKRSARQPTPTPATSPESGEQWMYTQSEDPMGKGMTYTAMVQSTNTVTFDFPYSESQHATLTLRTHPRYGKDVILQMERGQFLCDSYDGCNVLVRFDDGDAQTFSGGTPSDNSTELLFIRNYPRFVEAMLKAERVRISAEVYQEGSPVFEFDVHGFSASRYRPKP